MKKRTVIPSVLLVIIMFFYSCKELNRDNPYDPDGTDYIGITYKGELWYPTDSSPRAMARGGSFLYMAAYKEGTGDCVMKIGTESREVVVLGSSGTGTGSFTGISDLCADNTGNVYVVDSQNMVQIINSMDSFTSFVVPEITGTDRMYIEELAGDIFITSHMDSYIYKYSGAAHSFVDSRRITFTAMGGFEPGKIFTSGQYIFVVNDIRKNEVLKLDGGLATAGVIDFEEKIRDAAGRGDYMQVLCESAVFKVDNDLYIELKWGDFGTGPGRVLNGKLISYNPDDGMVYILDNETLKIFGE